VEIGSCTKVFTTTLLAMAVAQRQMLLNDSIQKYMPEGIRLRPAAQQVTLLELADFTSGMPDDPPDLPWGLERRSIEHYTTQDFMAASYSLAIQLRVRRQTPPELMEIIS
jgi:CubicO group peptidase (beta-lactamase class C family)